MKIKINIVFIPGINDKEIDNLIQFLCQYRVGIINIIPLLSVDGTKFGLIKPLTQNEFCEIKKELQDRYPNVKFKRSCQRCRADARGRIHS